MQAEQAPKNCTRSNAHHQLYLTLNDKRLQVIIMSKLTDKLSRTVITGIDMQENCLNLFGTVDVMYEFLEKNASNEDKVTITDIGEVRMTEVIDNKGKNIKIGASFMTEKVENKDELSLCYINIIRRWESGVISKHVVPSQPLKIRTIQRNLAFQKMYLNVSMDNPYLQIFSKHNNTLKVQQHVNKRLKLVFKEIIPKDKNTYVSVKVVRSKANIFGIGLIDKRQNPANKSFYSLCYDFSNGNIKDSNFNRDGKECSWRKIAPNASTMKDSIVRMQINMKEGRVAYYRDGEWICQTVMPSYMLKSQLVVYLSLKTQGDQFILNHE